MSDVCAICTRNRNRSPEFLSQYTWFPLHAGAGGIATNMDADARQDTVDRCIDAESRGRKERPPADTSDRQA